MHKSALKEAKDLQKQGEFEAARLRYQHVLGLRADMYGVNGTVITESILDCTTEEIGKSRCSNLTRV